MFIWELRDARDGSTLSFHATEKEIRSERKWWRERGGLKARDLENIKVEFIPNRAGIANLLKRYGVRG